LSITLGDIPQERPIQVPAAKDDLSITLGDIPQERPIQVPAAKDDLSITLGDIPQELPSTALSVKDDMSVTLGAVGQDLPATSLFAKDDLTVTLGAVGQESHAASFGATDDLSITMGDIGKDPLSTSLGARDDLSVTLGVCKETQAVSSTAKDDLAFTLGNVGVDGNSKVKITFTTQEENDKEADEKEGFPVTTGERLPAVDAPAQPSREEPKLQSPMAPSRHPNNAIAHLLDQTLDCRDPSLDAEALAACEGDLLMETVITADHVEQSKALDNSCMDQPGERDRATNNIPLDGNTPTTPAAAAAARESASPGRPVQRATSGNFGSFTALNALDMSFATYDEACMELHKRELHLSLRESLLAQLPGSTFPKGTSTKSMSQAPNATPRATLLVRPATMDKVGTVCRKPRPKAMQRGRISAP